jgi:signal transduction histidine kinase
VKGSSLALRITLMLGAICLVALGAGSFLMDWQVDHELEHRFEQSLATEAQALLESVAADPGARVPPAGIRGGKVEWLPSGVLRSEGRSYFDVRCGDAAPVLSDPPPPVRPGGWPAAAPGRPRRFGEQDLGGEHLGWLILQAPLPAPDGTPAATPPASCRLLLIQHRTKLDEIMLAIDWILILSPLTVLGTALIAVPLVVRRGLDPLNRLGERMHDIGPDAPGRRLEATGLAELDPLVARFNGVLARMDEGLVRERQFASGLAHETRTRLAELRALAEVEASYPSGRGLPEILGEVRRIGGELETTVVTLLRLTRLQSGGERPRLEDFALAPWLAQIARHQLANGSGPGVALRQELDPDLRWHSDPALLELAVGNLLGNALAYAPPGDIVRLRADAGGIAIDNAAPDLVPADLEHFGERFWRKQAPHSAHAGLGLALAGAAAQALRLRLEYRLRAGRLQATLRP